MVLHNSRVLGADANFRICADDVFTGGAEPIELFTYEFLTDLSNLLKSDGTIAIVSTGATRRLSLDQN